MTLMLNTKISEADIVCCVDNDKSIQGKCFCGYNVKSQDFLLGFDGDILILSMHGYEGITKWIKDMRISNEIIVLERV